MIGGDKKKKWKEKNEIKIKEMEREREGETVKGSRHYHRFVGFFC